MLDSVPGKIIRYVVDLLWKHFGGFENIIFSENKGREADLRDALFINNKLNTF